MALYIEYDKIARKAKRIITEDEIPEDVAYLGYQEIPEDIENLDLSKSIDDIKEYIISSRNRKDKKITTEV